MKRYDIDFWERKFVKSFTGYWIKYSDHESERRELYKTIDRNSKKIISLKENDLIQEEEIIKLIAENKKLRGALEKCNRLSKAMLRNKQYNYIQDITNIAYHALKESK